MKLSIIVPAYNEQNTIREVLRRVHAQKFGPIEKEIIIVDDGSTDGTADLLKAHANTYRIVTHERNRGKGAAVKTGLAHATGDYVLIQDADLEYDPADVPRLIAALKQNPNAIYGSRNLGKTRHGYLPYLWGGRLVTAVANLLFSMRLTDVTTGYKLIRRDLLASLNLEANDFTFCEEVTAKLAQRNIPIHEVPISYAPRTFSQGKKIRWHDGVRAIAALVRLYFTR